MRSPKKPHLLDVYARFSIHTNYVYSGAAEIVLACCTSYIDADESLVPIEEDKFVDFTMGADLGYIRFEEAEAAQKARAAAVLLDPHVSKDVTKEVAFGEGKISSDINLWHLPHFLSSHFVCCLFF
ncbi:hypothetical protein POM88_051482 [Heracleum sosnowskyi]|uniref:XRRM domain-containing protein n=1 Tax=Heracleum sosnowskyi TaxID=360622 RepID=A0AAD8H2B6_9APIA|nr:hypothetical protein POM88_051482 [Heracleum sosnowskyi]